MGRYINADVTVSARYFNRVSDAYPEIKAPNIDLNEDVILINKGQSDEIIEFCSKVVDAFIADPMDDQSILTESVLLRSIIYQKSMDYQVDNDPQMEGVDWDGFTIAFA